MYSHWLLPSRLRKSIWKSDWAEKKSFPLFAKLRCKCRLCSLQEFQVFLFYDWLNPEEIQFEPAITFGCPFHDSLVGLCNFSSPNCPITALDKEFNMEKRVSWAEIDGRQMWSKCRRMQICRNRRCRKSFNSIGLYSDYFQHIAKWLRVTANISNSIDAKEITERYFWCGRKRGSVFTFSGLKHVAKQNESWTKKMLKFYLWFFTLCLHIEDGKVLRSWAQDQTLFELKQKFMQSLFVAMRISYVLVKYFFLSFFFTRF